ncbi:MAG: response regulator transcription factor [Sulfuricellaceae bacterium]
MIRILIADDHSIVRHGLKQIVEESGEMRVVAEAANGADALHKMREIACDVVLLDISMPGKNGIDVLKQIKEEKPKLPVLILSIYPEDQYAVRLIKAGASGYMTKESAPMEVVEAVRRVAGGKKYISPAVAEMLANGIGSPEEKRPHETLSDREYQIFLLFASAKTATEIADALALSVKTVSTHRSRILEKMHLRNNAEMMHYAIENNLVQQLP